MNGLLWCVTIAAIALGLAERRRLTGRLAALETTVAAIETDGPSWGDAPGVSPTPADVGRATAPPRTPPAQSPVPEVGRREPRPDRHDPQSPSGTAAKAAVPPRTSSTGASASSPRGRDLREENPPIPRSPRREISPRSPIAWPRFNLPAVLGVVISLFGFSFLLRLAIDQGWIRFSIGARHVAVGLVGAALIGLGWRLRNRARAYSRTLIGGGFATLCLTVSSATLVFDLLEPPLGFAMLVATVAGAGVVASVLASRTLAILGLVGGLAAPVLLGSGRAGLAEVLAYYAVFALATLGLAMRHHWRFLDGLAFVGTFGSAALWATVHRYFGDTAGAGVQVAIWALGAIWVGIALSAPGRRRGRFAAGIERCILLGTPSATLGLFAIAGADADGLAWRALTIGVLYLGGGLLLGRVGLADRMRAHLLVAAGIAFAALAVPLGLDGEWITLAWATGGALQAWIATRNGQRGYSTAAVGLLVLASAYHLAQLVVSSVAVTSSGYFDATFVAGIGLTAAAVLTAWRMDRDRRSNEPWASLRGIALGLGVVGWLGTHVEQIAEWTDGYRTVAPLLALVAATALLCERSRWPLAHRITVGFPPAVLALFVASFATIGHPLAGFGAWAWPVALGVLFLVSRSSSGRARTSALWTLHVVGPAVVLWEVHDLVGRAPSGAWPIAVVLALLSGWIAFVTRRLGDGAVVRERVVPTLLAGLGLVLTVTQFTNGATPPLPYLPLLNAIDLATIAALAVFARALSGRRASVVASVSTVASVTVVCLTMTALRTVHHFAGVPFRIFDLLNSMTAHTTVTVTWAAAAVTAMVAGALRARRDLWLVGAVVMGAAVAKLFGVDLAGVDTAARIVSFLGVGAQLLALGYLSPVPPRAPVDRAEAEPARG